MCQLFCVWIWPWLWHCCISLLQQTSAEGPTVVADMLQQDVRRLNVEIRPHKDAGVLCHFRESISDNTESRAKQVSRTLNPLQLA